LTGGNSMWDVNASVEGPYNVADPQLPGEYWSVLCDDVVDHAVESNATHVWFNLVMPYESFLQIIAHTCCSILSQDWCIWHGDWPGTYDDTWIAWHNPATSPLYDADPHSPGPNLDAALGSGPYMLDYWDKGAGHSWSIIKSPSYWRGWAVPYDPEGWGPGFTIQAHVERYTSNYIPSWNMRRLRFLNGDCDFCDVPRQYMGQVDGQPGIECIYPLPYVGSEILCFNFNVSMSSTHMGMFGPLQRPLPPGFFNESGAPCDIFNDVNVRLGFAHLFDYQTYIYSAWLNEAISPVTPVVPGLTYYDPSIGKSEEPNIDQRKEYGISTETANQLAYDLALARTYLTAAWSGLLWNQGFTMDLVYSCGDLEGLKALELIKDGLYNLNTKFHVNITCVSSSEYKTEMRQGTLPLFLVNWLVDFPDAHAAVFPFMHTVGTYSRMQNYSSSFADTNIDLGLAALDPESTQAAYSALQQWYVDNTLGMVLAQPTGRHWERDWVAGWYYNALYPGNYAYDLWKTYPHQESVDVAVTGSSAFCLEIGLPVGADNPVILPVPVIEVDIARLDSNSAVGTIQVAIAVGLRNATGYEIIIKGMMDYAALGIPGGGLDTYTAHFEVSEQDLADVINPGTYTPFAVVITLSAFAVDIDLTNNRMDAAATEVDGMVGDINVDGYVELMDVFLMSQAYGSYPGSPRWDVRCDLNQDGCVELMDFYIVSTHFGEIYENC
jgi:peptide/nickel transport system substrate-binding protein